MEKPVHSRPQPEVFQYPPSPRALFVPSWQGGEEADEEVDWQHAPAPQGNGTESIPRCTQAAECERRHAGETRRSMESARAEGIAAGIEEGRRQQREAQAAAEAAGEAERAGQLASVVRGFAAQRERYLHELEREVVRLALAVAARILRREAQSDPLLLLGAVRVALGQVAASSQVRLRVPPSDLDLWTAALALLPHQTVKPTVVAGEGMRVGDCVLETSLGSADLGVRSQLSEIEAGLLAGEGGAGSTAGACRGANAGPEELAR